MGSEVTRILNPLSVIALVGLLSACSPASTGGGLASGGAAPGHLNIDKLNTGIDNAIGGIDTCVVVLDTKTGRRVYGYGQAEACMAQLPPCATFDIPATLIGLNQGVIDPKAVLKYDGSPQPISAWKTDADLNKAFSQQIGWWFQHLASAIRPDRFAGGLRDMDYGDHNTAGPPTAFWMGPQAGGALTITEGQQADFIHRFYAGDLKIKPDAIALVQGLTHDETRPEPGGGQAVISGRGASCATVPDGSRNVGWWVGRVQTPWQDLSISASVEGPDAPPGLEIGQRLKDVFTDAGLLPPAAS